MARIATIRRAPTADAREDRGAVTAELALALPAVVMVLGLVLGTASAVQARLMCLDAAAAGARLASRSEPMARVVQTVTSTGPPGASVSVSSTTDQVIVSVRAPVRLPLPGSPEFVVTGRASALKEAT